MSRIRTLSQAYDALKEMDKHTAVTPNALRRMVVSGQISCTRAGKKYLIDLDVLLEYLKGTKPNEVNEDSKVDFKAYPKMLK